MTEAYPLAWPKGRPRTAQRRRAQFNKKVPTGRGYDQTKELTVADALSRLQNEIDRLGARQYVLSSNLQTRLDGMPRSGQAEPSDSGAALYFHLDGKPHCLPCDTYDRVADNIAAIAKHIEATRAIERYGVASLSEMFAGFTALPGTRVITSLVEVLDVSQHAGADEINAAYRSKAKSAHSDAGGSDAAMAALNVARDEGMGKPK